LSKDLDRTHSCKCFTKHDRSTVQPSHRVSRLKQLTPSNSSKQIKSQVHLSPSR